MQPDEAHALDADTVITRGGWHPSYARVLLILQVDDEALVLVDSNGDGAEVESEQWHFTDDGWVDGISSGIGPFEGDPLWSWGWTSGTGHVVGCASPGQNITVEWRGRTQEAVANDLGVWAALFPGTSEEEFAELGQLHPRVVEHP
jgi:hypothetical protein